MGNHDHDHSNNNGKDGTNRIIRSPGSMHRLPFAEMRASLIAADLHERELYPHMPDWPSDIGFVICPANDWLIELQQEEADSNLPKDQGRITALTIDLQKLHSGWRPGIIDLYAAPVITPNIIFVTRGREGHAINLAGHVRNVPGGGPDRRRVISPVAAFDANRFTWVRTLSRFYRVEPNPEPACR